MKKKRGVNVFYAVTMLMFLAFVVAFMGMPLLSLISTSLSSPETGGFSLENFVSIFTSKFYFQSFRNSFVLSLQSSL